MLRFLLALVIIASVAVIVQKLNLLNGLFPQANQIPVSEPVSPTDETTSETRSITKSEVYRWVDDEGTVHFSDKAIDEDQSNIKKITVSTETTEFAKTPKIKPVYIPSNRQTSSQTSRSKRCQRLKTEIAERERRLRKSGASHLKTLGFQKNAGKKLRGVNSLLRYQFSK